MITVSNTCAPTIAAIRLTGATPVFVDVREDDLLMDLALVEKSIGSKTRCILPVHLWGGCVEMDRLMELARARRIPVVEDCAQAHRSLYDGRPAGTFGAAGCFSMRIL